MAGAGRKVFVAGEVLTASDVNGYLMDQSVMRFATASARSADIASPTEGMVSYLDDTNSVEVYSGSAWSGIGAGVFAQYTFSASAALGFTVGPSDSISIAGTVTFPAGRFTLAPVVLVTLGQYSAAIAGCPGLLYSATSSTTQATVYFKNANISASATTSDFAITAIQATAGSAKG